MRIIIFANGTMDNPGAEAARWVSPGDTVIAADGGTRHALAAGSTPTMVIGDLDSLNPNLHEQLQGAGTHFCAYPPEKDETDLELALLWAAKEEADEIIVLGALGGRPDQELANLLLLALPTLASHSVILAGDGWIIRCIRGGETVTLHGTPGATVSLIPLGGDAHGVTTSGLRYPLHNETLHFGPARGISNAMKESKATVRVAEGMLWCFHKESGSA